MMRWERWIDGRPAENGSDTVRRSAGVAEYEHIEVEIEAVAQDRRSVLLMKMSMMTADRYHAIPNP